MNIMLVSVTERTREIGLRLAVGVQPADRSAIARTFVTKQVYVCAFKPQKPQRMCLCFDLKVR